jgi:hypothetical protein
MKTLQYKVEEGQDIVRLKHKGYRMTTDALGRRRRSEDRRFVPNGIWHGEVFYAEMTSHTGDWGNGVETHVGERIIPVATIAPNPDRDLVERLTLAVFKAIEEANECGK